jgi:hypothetical protein
MNKIQDQFRKLFWQHDLETLRGFGVPDDEYDGEADMAFEVIKANDSIEEIEWKVISIFHIWFSPSELNPIEKEYVPPKFELINNIPRLINLKNRYNSKLVNLAKDLKEIFTL